MKGVVKGAWVDVPEPVKSAGETIVEVHAAGVNRADLLQIAGFYPPPPGTTEVLGLEAAGIDTETGKRVCCLLAGGGMAERVAVDRRLLIPIPDTWTFAQAAAVPEAFLTAFSNVIEIGKLKEDETLLIHAVTSGVGTAAVQLAKLVGAKVIGSGRNPDKLARVADLDDAVTVWQHVRADVILDVFGGGALEANVACLKDGGRLVVIALMQGTAGELDMRALLSRRLQITGSTLRARRVDEKARLTHAFSPWLPKITPVVDSEFSFDQCDKAFARMQANENVGKIVLCRA